MSACSIHFHGGWLWKSNVKRRKSVLTLLVEIERVSVLSGSHTRKSVLEDEVFIENTCHGVGSKNEGRN